VRRPPPSPVFAGAFIPTRRLFHVHLLRFRYWCFRRIVEGDGRANGRRIHRVHGMAQRGKGRKRNGIRKRRRGGYLVRLVCHTSFRAHQERKRRRGGRGGKWAGGDDGDSIFSFYYLLAFLLVFLLLYSPDIDRFFEFHSLTRSRTAAAGTAVPVASIYRPHTLCTPCWRGRRRRRKSRKGGRRGWKKGGRDEGNPEGGVFDHTVLFPWTYRIAVSWKQWCRAPLVLRIPMQRRAMGIGLGSFHSMPFVPKFKVRRAFSDTTMGPRPLRCALPCSFFVVVFASSPSFRRLSLPIAEWEVASSSLVAFFVLRPLLFLPFGGIVIRVLQRIDETRCGGFRLLSSTFYVCTRRSQWFP